MTVADVVRAIRARWLLFTVCCIVPIAAAAFAAARASAPVYSATAGLIVEPTRLAEGVDAYQSAYSAAQLAQLQTPSYASLVDSPAVLRAVIADLHLATTPSQLSRTSLCHLAAKQRRHRHYGERRLCCRGARYR